MKKIQGTFTRGVQKFLTEQGYSHIYNFGILTSPNENGETYLLIPLRPGDPRLEYEETDRIIEAIESNGVYDMADGDEFISFVIEMTEAEWQLYHQTNQP